MSKVIKVKSSKNGFSPVKVKVVANEHYIIVDKSGKSFKKLKFIKKDNNLEIYAQQDGKEEQVVVLENYNTPNINASVVSLDSVTNQEISYIYNSSDSWSYINGELSSTELGFAFPLLGLGAAGVGVAVASRGDSSSSSESNTPSATVIDNLTDAEVAGLSDAQLAALTPAQIVAMESAGNLDNLTAAQISKLAPLTIAALSDATMAAMATAGKLDNLTNAQVLALPASTIDSVPATVIDNLTDAEVAGLSLAKVQALTSAQLISLGAIGTLDNLSHPVTITQLNGIQPSITLSTASTSLINDYINSIVNGNTTQESTINTQAKIQGLISIVDKIAALAAGGTPALAETDFATIGITGVTASNLAIVNSYINSTADDGTGIDTLSEIQALANAVVKTTLLSDGTLGNGTASNLTNTDITALGLAATINDTEELKLFNEVLDKASASSVDTASKVANIASIVDNIATLAAGGTVTPALAETDFATIGITGVNASNLATVLSLIPATANDGTGIDTLSEIQRIFDTSSLAGQNMIELGSYGNLIKGVQVEGNWYYYWDRSGDGTSANTQGSSNGTTSSYATDTMTMDWIESTFFGSSTGTVITESNRTFSINGVSVALPTANGGVAYPGSINSYQPGTSYTDAGATTNGTTSTYNDLLAIWDAYNGTTTGTNVSGTPSGWTAGGYLSASPSSYGHAGVNLYNGHVGDGGNNDNLYVALQVL